MNQQKTEKYLKIKVQIKRMKTEAYITVKLKKVVMLKKRTATTMLALHLMRHNQQEVSM